ncbi:MAG: DUF4129 domain-containing protein [Cyanobacteria bacterium P01_A01_bin.84]
MSAKSYTGADWSWNLSKFWQKTQEWIEYQFNNLEGRNPNNSWNWTFSEHFITFLKVIFWLLLALFTAWVLWELWKEFSPYLYSWWDSDRYPTKDSQTPVKQIPLDQWLVRSSELYRQGNYPEACRCLYFAMLQDLHQRKVLLNKRSRTDGEYLRILGLSISPMQPYETLITTHEQLCFSTREIAAENYQQCQQAYQEISQP